MQFPHGFSSFPAYIHKLCMLFTVHHLGYYRNVFTLVSPVFSTCYYTVATRILSYSEHATYHYLIIRKYYCQCKSVVRLEKESNFSEFYILSISSLLRAEGYAYIVDAGVIV